MAAITMAHGLPFVTVVIGANGQTIRLENILLDIGSASTIFRTDDVEQLRIV
jgi:hypothetical protein